MGRRPPRPLRRTVWILEDKYSGVTSPEKIKMLRRDMRHAGADAHILTTLDEIAWLLNVRGNDIPCTPVFLSYALITETECKLFIQNAAVPEPVRTYLDGIGVTLLPYDSIYGEIQKLEHLSLLLEKAKVNYRLVSALSPTVRVIDQMNPCVMRKVVKNPVEIENVRSRPSAGWTGRHPVHALAQMLRGRNSFK